MTYIREPYGIAWKTLSSAKPTSVWFSSKINREQYHMDLKRNPLVKKNSITFFIKDEKGRTKKE